MDPSHCTIVYQALDQPYIIKEEQDYNNDDGFHNNRELLDSVFGQGMNHHQPSYKREKLNL
jgi:hypothetical protein